MPYAMPSQVSATLRALEAAAAAAAPKCATIGCDALSTHTVVWDASEYPEPVCTSCARYYAKRTDGYHVVKGVVTR